MNLTAIRLKRVGGMYPNGLSRAPKGGRPSAGLVLDLAWTENVAEATSRPLIRVCSFAVPVPTLNLEFSLRQNFTSGLG